LAFQEISDAQKLKNLGEKSKSYGRSHLKEHVQCAAMWKTLEDMVFQTTLEGTRAVYAGVKGVKIKIHLGKDVQTVLFNF
jgi:hypothetical protein